MKKSSVLRSIACITAGLLPAAVILFGIWLLFGGSILTGSYICTFFVIPALALVGCVRAIRSGLHPVLRGLLCVAALALMMVLMVFLLMVGQFSVLTELEGTAALEEYQVVADTVPEFPAVSELGTPEKVEYYHFFNVFGTFFDSDCDILICGYSASEYARQKSLLDTRHTFRQEAATALSGSIPPAVTVDGYDFRLMEYEEMSPGYPKRMVFAAVNDETREIVYAYYVDDDLDYIDSLETHIRRFFGWKYIR